MVREPVRRHPSVRRADRRQPDSQQLGLEAVQQQDLSIDGSGRRPARTVRRTRFGASLGRTKQFALLSFFRLPGGQGTKNDLAGFEGQGFVTVADDGDLDFDYHGRYADLVRSVTADDLRWMCELMSRLSDAQWRAAFRAGGYDEDAQSRYVAKIKHELLGRADDDARAVLTLAGSRVAGGRSSSAESWLTRQMRVYSPLLVKRHGHRAAYSRVSTMSGSERILWLADSSRDATVVYFRCGDCGHV